ncbi:MAG TPA: GNAT family N-acetyltransferase [Actinoallomurus sp.]|nr:GNAT family N-acetyltransferase [Actinoallomurus sp.]
MQLRTPSPAQASLLAPHLAATHAVLDDERLVGGLALTPVRPGAAELTFWVSPEQRRRGVASAAVRALCEQTGERLEMVTDITDTISQRVALNAGFTREAVRRGGRLLDGGRRRDEVVWARLPGDPPGPAARPLPDLPGEVLGSGEVTLRPLGMADVDDVFVLLNLADVRARMVYPFDQTRAGAERRCAGAASEWLAGIRAAFTVRVNEEFAGDLAMFNEAFCRQAAVGYSMRPEFRGRGVATQAVRLLSTWAFAIGVQRLVAGTAPDNLASQRVLEKAGFVRETIERSRFEGPDGTRVDDFTHVLFPARG